MGNTYNNLTVKDAERDGVIALLQEKGYRAFVAPSVNGCTVVWHDFFNSPEWQEADDEGNVPLRELSRDLNCTLLAVSNYDDDILTFDLWKNGQLVDGYDSINVAGYWGPYDDDEETATHAANYRQRRSDTTFLCNTFGVPHNREAVDNLLHKKEFTFEVERHQQLVELLGLPDYAVGFDFNDIESNYLPEGLTREEIAGTGS